MKMSINIQFCFPCGSSPIRYQESYLQFTIARSPRNSGNSGHGKYGFSKSDKMEWYCTICVPLGGPYTFRNIVTHKQMAHTMLCVKYCQVCKRAYRKDPKSKHPCLVQDVTAAATAATATASVV